MYTAVYRNCLARNEISELTIEDPAEVFEDLRDKTDLRMLFSHKEFMDKAYGDPTSGKPGKLGPPSDKEWIESWRKRLKMANVCTLRSVYVVHPADFWCYKRQFERLMEMLILRRLDPSDAAALKAYRLQVKERLYRFNFVSNTSHFSHSFTMVTCVRPNSQEILVTIEKEERLEKLEETFQSVVEGYQSILGLLEG